MAILRSPYAHARITSIDLPPPLALPGVVAAYTGADLMDEWANPMPCAWPVTEDMKNPPHHPLAVGQGLLRRRRRRAWWPPDEAARDALEPSRSTTSRSTAVVDLEDALSDRGARPRRPRHQQVLHLGAPPRRRRRRARFAAAAHVVKERYIQQRLIPMAMEPGRRRGAPALRRRHHALLGHPDPPHPQGDARGDLGHPRAAGAGRRPVGRRRVRPKLDVYAEELLVLALAKKHRRRCAGSRSAPRTRRPPSRAGARSRTSSWPPTPTASSSAVRVHLLADMGAYLQLVTPGIPLLGGVPLPRRLRRARLLVHLHVGVHHHDPDRRLPRRRPARGHLRHRAGDGRPRPRDRRRPGRAPAAQLHPQGPVPVHRRDRPGLRLGRPRGALDKALELADYDARARRAGRAAGGGAPSTSASASPRTSRCAGWRRPRAVLAQLLGRRLGVRHRADLPTNKVQVVTGATPHGQGHETSWSMIVADGSASSPTTSRSSTPTPPSAPSGMDTYGSRSLAGRRRRHRPWRSTRSSTRPGDRRAPARGGRGRPRVLEAGSSRWRLARPRRCRWPQIAFAAFTAHDLPEGLEPNLEAQVTYDPPNFSWPFGTHVCVVEIDEETGRSTW